MTGNILVSSDCVFFLKFPGSDSEQRKADNEFLFPSHPYFIWFLNSKNSKFFEILAILSFLTFDIKMKGLGECFDLG